MDGLRPPSAAAPTPVVETRGANAISLAPTPRLAVEVVPQPAPTLLPEVVASPASIGDATDFQRAVVEALAAANQSSAADAMADATWILASDEARVQTDLSKTMLPVVLNPEAEKIARAALRDSGIHKLTMLPGTATPAADKKSRPARTGSVQAKALEHPMVQQAQRLFAAELQTVIDLREES